MLAFQLAIPPRCAATAMTAQLISLTTRRAQIPESDAKICACLCELAFAVENSVSPLRDMEAFFHSQMKQIDPVNAAARRPAFEQRQAIRADRAC
jgi:hypothetical protein